MTVFATDVVTAGYVMVLPFADVPKAEVSTGSVVSQPDHDPMIPVA
jgi:hypothetical protein